MSIMQIEITYVFGNVLQMVNKIRRHTEQLQFQIGLELIGLSKYIEF